MRLFILGEGEIKSTEGTSQGDPLAMAMYALAITPLINKLIQMKPDVKQVWFVDDGKTMFTTAMVAKFYRSWAENRIIPKCQ